MGGKTRWICSGDGFNKVNLSDWIIEVKKFGRKFEKID